MQKKLPILTFALSLLFFTACTPKVEVDPLPPGASSLKPFRTSAGKWGFNDSRGKTAIEAKFDNVTPFLHGVARVKVGDKYGYIEESGKSLIEPKYAEAGRFNGNLAPVKIDAKFGFIDKTGKVALEAKYDYAQEFTDDGFAAVRLGDNEGYIDKEGAFKEGDPPGTAEDEAGVGDEPEPEGGGN